jgi:predicted secreted protein
MVLKKSRKIKLKLSKTAENGKVVPITSSSIIDNIVSVDILSEKNPVLLVAKFTLDHSLEPLEKVNKAMDTLAVTKFFINWRRRICMILFYIRKPK